MRVMETMTGITIAIVMRRATTASEVSLPLTRL